METAKTAKKKKKNKNLLFLIAMLLLPPCRPEFTVVMPDSSVLVDRPPTSFSDRARTDPAEQRAVYDIMEATGNGWAKTIPDVCRGRWHGIECMPDRHDVYHVVSLAFGALSDDTAFPTCDSAHPFLSPSLVRLPHLRSLFFYRCLSANPQPIPPFLGRLGATLRTLVLRDNGHIGPMPEELGNLTCLKTLDLHGNALSSSVPRSVGGLLGLQSLDLSNNRLSGAVPEMSFPRLAVLDLSHNRFQGQIPDSISECESLVKLDLSRNRLTGSIPGTLKNLHALILLDLGHNLLSGPLPAALGSLPSLRSLILKSNPMSSATIPDGSFSGLKDLETLVLSDMGLGGTIPESIGELRSIRVLHLDGNGFNGSIPRSFAELERLSELRVNDNRLWGPVPFGREVVWRMGRKLRVYNNSGLCFDGRDEGVRSLLGVGQCEDGKEGEGKKKKKKRRRKRKKVEGKVTGEVSDGNNGEKVKHLWKWNDEHDQASSSRSSAPVHGGRFAVFFVMSGLHVCVLPLLKSLL